MKPIIRKIGTVSGVAILAAGLLLGNNARAGQNEWATAGKILAGVLAADVLFNHLPLAVYSPPAIVYETRVVREYCPPPPPIVYKTRVVREYYAPPPVVYYGKIYDCDNSRIQHSGWRYLPSRSVIYKPAPYRNGPAAPFLGQPLQRQSRVNFGRP